MVGGSPLRSAYLKAGELTDLLNILLQGAITSRPVFMMERTSSVKQLEKYLGSLQHVVIGVILGSLAVVSYRQAFSRCTVSANIRMIQATLAFNLYSYHTIAPRIVTISFTPTFLFNG